MMKELIYSSITNLPKIQIKIKTFEKESMENFSTNLSSYSSVFQNSFYYKNSIKKLTCEEYFNKLLFKMNSRNTIIPIEKEDLAFLLKKKQFFSQNQVFYLKKKKNYYKIARFYSIKNISLSPRRKIFSILQSPHVFKKSQEHFEYKINQALNILSCSNNLEKDRFFLLLKNLIFKKYSGLQIQYNIISSNYFLPKISSIR